METNARIVTMPSEGGFIAYYPGTPCSAFGWTEDEAISNLQECRREYESDLYEICSYEY